MAGNSERSAKRRGPGRPFQPGQSGNPKGRPKVDPTVVELAREHGPAVIAELARLALNSKSETTRVAAGREILNRAYGCAPQQIDLGSADGAGLAVRVEWVKPEDAE